MNKKVIIVLAIIIIALICAILIFNANVEVEYVPEVEVEDTDLRKTIVVLYFKDANSGEIQKECRLIDSKDLLLDPYTVLVNMLINGPESENLERIIPEKTIINNIRLADDCLYIDFSAELIENNEDKTQIIESIEKTMTELNEINSVEITVDGGEA